ncbi:hypothetical protein [Dongia sp.]|uniref:hypothetical protein n=1 Tax=Dongia sp. TaxID=1977262 RepID=UPI0035B2E19F
MDRIWLTNALEVTGGFENPGNPWSGVAGDFDGMGLSAGALQWNIGQGSLQPLVRAAGRDAVCAAMPIHGPDFWRACEAPIRNGLGLVRQWQGHTARLPSDLTSELRAFLVSAPMREQQMRAAERIGRRAQILAETWARSLERRPSLRDFCWFFDLVTQNGGLKGLSLGDVKAFITRHGDAAKAIAEICDWLAAMPRAYAGFKDCRHNATLWRDAESGDRYELLILSYLRALKSRPEYAGTVMNRKGTIATGIGWVNAKMCDLRSRLKDDSMRAA